MYRLTLPHSMTLSRGPLPKRVSADRMSHKRLAYYWSTSHRTKLIYEGVDALEAADSYCGKSVVAVAQV
jgi:hypothetical protein